MSEQEAKPETHQIYHVFSRLPRRNDQQWNSKKRKPVTLGINNYITHILFNQKLLTSIQTTLAEAEAGYWIVGVTVEKVLKCLAHKDD